MNRERDTTTAGHATTPRDTALDLNQGASGDTTIRMMMYSHDTFGLGHLQRCLKISRALIETIPDLSILIVTGSPVVHRFELPARVDYIKLPAVRKIGPETYEARSLGTRYESIIRLRRALLLETVKEYRPHLLLVDHSPSGMKGEMLPALEWIGQSGLPCVRMLGLRDIIDDPAAVRELWHDQGVYELLASSYDTILIYGPQEIFDPVLAYRFPPAVKSKVRFCNYIGEHEDNNDTSPSQKARDRKKVVVTIGGGDGASEILSTFLEMVETHRDQIDFDSVLVTGPFVDNETYADLERRARSLPVQIERFVPSTSPLFAQSDLVVATAGYNTITQILSHARRALIIPRVLYRDEQLMRAKLLAAAGWIDMMEPEAMTASHLLERVLRLLNDSRESVAEARKRQPFLLNGATQVATIIAETIHAATVVRER